MALARLREISPVTVKPSFRFPLPAESNSDDRAIDVQLRERDEHGPLTEDEIESLILQYRANARKLSRSILRRWRSRLELEELDSLVDLALCEAARRYNPAKGASFMTFLFYHLRGCLVRAVDTAANLNTIPAASFEINELSADQDGDGFISGSASDIAQALCNHEHVLPDEILYKREVAGLSNSACERLDALEQEVVYRIYALEQPLVDIARTLGYSRCHISRVKKKALEVLFDHLAPSLGMEGKPRPSFEDEEDDRISSGSSRRPIVRRKLNGKDGVKLQRKTKFGLTAPERVQAA